ncbi:unnamed protein product [Prorocentrum cordatum]|uniref:CCHC-type domain-containing protein n=1 Tax=Prorocentrum cordatum TaxID=2364126 RepID=A0ABN9U9A1_9DINO|nr:unnamed protein product [Polarella glacialis]
MTEAESGDNSNGGTRSSGQESIEQVIEIAQQWQNEDGQFHITAEQMRTFVEQARSLMVTEASSAGQGVSSKATADADNTKNGQGDERDDQLSWNSSARWSKVGDTAAASPAPRGERDPWQSDGQDPWSQASRSWTDKYASWKDHSNGWQDRFDSWRDTSNEWQSNYWQSRDWNGSKWGEASGTEKWKTDERRGRDFADPEAWPGWSEFKLWRRKVMRWRQTTDVDTHKHADRIMKLLPIDLQRKLEDITDEDLISDNGADKVIARLDLLSGERVGDEKRKAGRECLFSFQRKQGEGLTEYAARLDLAFDKVGTLGLPLPDDWKYMFLEEGAGLGERGTQLMKIQMKTKDSYKEALAAIREMDVARREHLSIHRSRAYHVEQSEDTDSLLDWDDVSSLDTEGEAEIYVALDKMDLYDDELKYAFNTMQEDRRKTWKQNRDLKRKLKVDRKFFDRSKENDIKSGDKSKFNRGHRSAKGEHRPRRNRLPLAELIKRTKCRSCGKKGHWSRECPDRNGQSHSASATGGGTASFVTGYVHANVVDPNAPEDVSSGQERQQQDELVLLTVPPGEAVVDTAAGVKVGMNRLPSGHRTIRIDDFQASGADFKCPEAVFQRHPSLKESDFHCDCGRSGSSGKYAPFYLTSSGDQGAQLRERRPATMAEQVAGTDTTWTYAVTGTTVPDHLNKAQRSWACMVGSTMFWLNKLADEFGRMMVTRRFWPTNLPKSLKVVPQAYYTCWHPPISVDYGCNGYGAWWVCSDCTMRVGYLDKKPDKTKKEPDVTCLCKRRTAACSLCGRGFAQQKGADPEWRALVAAPAPPPGNRGVTPAGVPPPWPAQAESGAAQHYTRASEADRADWVMSEAEGDLRRKKQLQRQEVAAAAAASGPATPREPRSRKPENGEDLSEVMQMLRDMSAKQEAQQNAISQLTKVTSGQVHAMALLQSQMQAQSPVKEQSSIKEQQSKSPGQSSQQPGSKQEMQPGHQTSIATTPHLATQQVPPEASFQMITTAPLVAAYPNYAAAPPLQEPHGQAKGHGKGPDNPTGLMDQRGNLLSSTTISSIDLPGSALPSQQLAAAAPQKRPSHLSRPSAEQGDPWKESPEEKQARDQRRKDAEEAAKRDKDRLARDGWTAAGWKSWDGWNSGDQRWDKGGQKR